jgi:hypothetical protein
VGGLRTIPRSETVRVMRPHRGDHNRAKTPSMPITQFLGNSKFDPETRRIMGVAFEMARVALNVADRGDLANEVIAKRIIELAKAGELNPDVLCEVENFASSACRCKRRPQENTAQFQRRAAALHAQHRTKGQRDRSDETCAAVAGERAWDARMTRT